LEDKQHIIWCPAVTAREQWKLSIQKLSRWMKDQGTAPEIHSEILSQLERWTQDEPIPDHTEQPFAEEQQ